MSASDQKITGHYHLIEMDTRDLSICYKTSDGDYVGRVPEKVIAYGFSDSFLAAKSVQSDTVSYYIIDIRKDADFADEKGYLAAKISLQEFDRHWRDKLNIEFKTTR